MLLHIPWKNFIENKLKHLIKCDFHVAFKYCIQPVLVQKLDSVVIVRVKCHFSDAGAVDLLSGVFEGVGRPMASLILFWRNCTRFTTLLFSLKSVCVIWK